MRVYVLTTTNDTFESVMLGVYSSPSRAIEAADRDPMWLVPKDAWKARVCYGEQPPVTQWDATVVDLAQRDEDEFLILEMQVDP